MSYSNLPKIHIAGSIAYDRIMNFGGKFEDNLLPDKLHMLNICFYIESIKELHGGTAANIAYNFYLLGGHSAIYTSVGKDFRGNYEQALEAMNIDLSNVEFYEKELCPCAYVTTDMKGNQITAFSPAALNNVTKIEFYPKCSTGDYGIVSPANLVDMVEFPLYFKQQGIPYIYDPGQCIPPIKKENHLASIDGSEIFIGNDYEIELIQEITGKSKDDLLKKTKCLITTLGEKGCEIAMLKEGKTETWTVPAPKIAHLADPTGAGDSFRAGLLFGILNKLDMQTSAKIGSISAAYCVEQLGTQEHAFTMDEFKKRYEENYGSFPL